MTTQIEKSNTNNELPKEILMEVLVRLPVKVIVRFKCVSKDWLNLLTSNATFGELYKARAHGRKGGIIHVIPPDNYYHTPSRAWDRRIFAVDMKRPPDVRGSVFDLSSLPFDVNMRTNIIDGLICFYNDTFGSIYVCNIFTREILRLPPAKEIYETRRCIIGYDRSNKEYKVVRVCTTKRHLNLMKCEVITLVNNEETYVPSQNDHASGWRSIDISYIDADYLWGNATDRGFYLNGVVYWISQYDSRNKKRGIILFDVEKEKFQIIKCPDQLFNGGDGTFLAHIQGHLSLVIIHVLHNSDPCRMEITWWKVVHGEDMESPFWTSTVFNCPFPTSCTRYCNPWRCDPRCHCNHLGQVFSVRWVVKGKCVVDCYDINTGKYKELRVNNAQGMLHTSYNFRPTLVAENIISFRSMKFKN